MDRRTKELEYALLGMVLQYCNDGGFMEHQFMGAGEEAFEVLGIRYGDPADALYARMAEVERELAPGYTQAREKQETTAWDEIRAILWRGNDAVIRKKGDGFIVMEDKREVKYQAKENRPG